MKKKVYENRELSWLKFNERVLKEAKREDVPLCERLNFLSIYQTNLDEFFMVRVGCLHDQVALLDEYKDDKSNMTSIEQIDAICNEVRRLDKKKTKIYHTLKEELAKQGIKIVDLSLITAEEEKTYQDLYKSKIEPYISPYVVGKRNPFPFLKNEDIYALAILRTKNGKRKIGITECENENLPRIISIPNKPGLFVLTEDLIKHCLPLVFKNYVVEQSTLIRVTRSADISLDKVYDEDLDYRTEMESVIKIRRKLMPVRIELTDEIDENITEQVCRFNVLESSRIFYSKTPLSFSYFGVLKKYLKNKKELFYPEREPIPEVTSGMLDRVLSHDVLLSYPFETMQPFIELLREAADSPYVKSIKITLYRVASKSQVVASLVKAAQNGKKVDVLVELKARFDEENNINWSKVLESSGCNVIYGWSGLKVHSKLCLITIEKDGKTRYITQVGTGNYNEKTAHIYTDLSLMTASDKIGSEAADIFDKLFSGKLVEQTQYLLVAPDCMKNKILDMIDEETSRAKHGEPAYIGAKLNSLTDMKIINSLIKASQAGVKIDLIVRGICCLNPGISGYTDNIRIISIVGQYLEHSRIYLFGSPERRKMYISSADWMTRNMSRRVEVAAPIYSELIKRRIQCIFDLMLNDDVKAREKKPNGKYKRVKGDYNLCTQEYLAENYGLNTMDRLMKAEDLLESIKEKEISEEE